MSISLIERGIREKNELVIEGEDIIVIIDTMMILLMLVVINIFQTMIMIKMK